MSSNKGKQDKPKNETPPQAEFGQLRSYLARNGYGIAQIIQAIGTAPNGRTRAEIANSLKEWLLNNQGE